MIWSVVDEWELGNHCEAAIDRVRWRVISTSEDEVEDDLALERVNAAADGRNRIAKRVARRALAVVAAHQIENL